jgi:hypothetical protein
MKISTHNHITINPEKNIHSLLALMLLTVAATTTFVPSTAKAEIYKWTDAQGQVHYSATPPTKKVKTREIGTEIKMAAGKFDPSTVKQKSETEDSDTENTEDSSQTKGKNKPTKERIAYCKTQRKNLALLKNNKNIRWKSFGKETELSDAQRKSKINSIKALIMDECKGI